MKTSGCYKENLRLNGIHKQMKWNEIEHSKSRYRKKIFDHVVSTTASVGELFSTECRTNMTLKSKQFKTPQKILVMQAFIKQF